MGLMDNSILLHMGLVLILLWMLSSFGCSHPIAYFFSLMYLYLVHERYVMRLRRKLQFEERKQANQRKVLSDSETVRWLNHAVERIWPICMESIASQNILLPIIPWFLEKYKPWTVRDAMVQHLYLGRNPPMFTEMRVLNQPSEDDHLVLELGMNFLTADDMSAILAVKLRRRLGFGMRAKLHLTGMHVEGKVLVGIKFLREWPYLGRLRLCFAEPPYFQMTIKPIFTHGLDVTELPGIAGWLEKLLDIAFERTLVEPNMLVVDMEKFVKPQAEDWFSVNVKEPVAHAKVEVIEGSDMKRSDLNGLADPYVKGQVGAYRFRTKIQRKTLAPKWLEEFKIPIVTWESQHLLAVEVRDKDHFSDDILGSCSVNISELRDGQRHDMWLPLQNVKTGRLHLAVTVTEGKGKVDDHPCNEETLNVEESEQNSYAADSTVNCSPSPEKFDRLADNYEPINIEGQKETGIWVHHPGSEVSKTWEPRKGRSRRLDTEIQGEPNDAAANVNHSASGYVNDSSSSSDENSQEKRPMKSIQRGLQKLGSVFHHRNNSKKEDKTGSSVEPVRSPHANVRATNAKERAVKLVIEDDLSAPVEVAKEESPLTKGSETESPGKRNVRQMARNIARHAEKSAQNFKHALSGKGSKHSQGDASGVVEREILLESQASDDDSISVDGTEIASEIRGSDFATDLPDANKHLVQTGDSESPTAADCLEVPETFKRSKSKHDKPGFSGEEGDPSDVILQSQLCEHEHQLPER